MFYVASILICKERCALIKAIATSLEPEQYPSPTSFVFDFVLVSFFWFFIVVVAKFRYYLLFLQESNWSFTIFHLQGSRNGWSWVAPGEKRILIYFLHIPRSKKPHSHNFIPSRHIRLFKFLYVRSFNEGLCFGCGAVAISYINLVSFFRFGFEGIGTSVKKVWSGEVKVFKMNHFRFVKFCSRQHGCWSVHSRWRRWWRDTI